MVFMSLVGARLAFGTPITRRAVVGASLGVGGVVLLFLPEILAAQNGGNAAIGHRARLSAPRSSPPAATW